MYYKRCFCRNREFVDTTTYVFKQAGVHLSGEMIRVGVSFADIHHIVVHGQQRDIWAIRHNFAQLAVVLDLDRIIFQPTVWCRPRFAGPSTNTCALSGRRLRMSLTDSRKWSESINPSKT